MEQTYMKLHGEIPGEIPMDSDRFFYASDHHDYCYITLFLW